MKNFTLLIGLILTSIIGIQAQTPNNSFYSNSVEKSGDQQFLKDSENPLDGRSWFRLSGSMGYSPILIGFVSGATDGYEDSYDGEFINEGASVEFYSFCDIHKLEIQGRSELEPYQVIQVLLGFEATTAGDYTISMVLDYIDTNFEILLEDTMEKTFTDLRTSNYTFNIENPIEDNSRFVMHYSYAQTLSADESAKELNNINSFFLNDELKTKVNMEDSPLSIQLFDIIGKEILNTTFYETLQTNNTSKGIYIIKYNFAMSKPITKKIIKR